MHAIDPQTSTTLGRPARWSRRRRLWARSALLAAMALATPLLPACTGPARRDTREPVAADSPDITGAWTLRTIGPDDAAALVGDDGRLPTLSIEPDGGVTGFAGVNRLSTRLDAAGASAQQPLFSPVITTKMAGPAPLMALESRLVAALSDTRIATVEAGHLTLYDARGHALATFAPAAP